MKRRGRAYSQARGCKKDEFTETEFAIMDDFRYKSFFLVGDCAVSLTGGGKEVLERIKKLIETRKQWESAKRLIFSERELYAQLTLESRKVVLNELKEMVKAGKTRVWHNDYLEDKIVKQNLGKALEGEEIEVKRLGNYGGSVVKYNGQFYVYFERTTPPIPKFQLIKPFGTLWMSPTNQEAGP